MFKLNVKTQEFDALKGLYDKQLMPSSPKSVARSVFEAYYLKATNLLYNAPARVCNGELEAYMYAPWLRLVELSHASRSVSADDKSMSNKVPAAIANQAMSYALIFDYMTITQSKAVANTMTLDLVRKHSMYKAIQAAAAGDDTLPDSDRAQGIYDTLQLWLGATNSYNAKADQAWVNNLQSYDPDNAAVLRVARHYLAPSWSDDGYPTFDSAIDPTLKDVYDKLLESAGRGEGFPMTTRRREKWIASCLLRLQMIRDIYEQGQDNPTSWQVTSSLTLIYWFVWYLEAKFLRQGEFAVQAFQVSSTSWASTIRSVAMRLSGIFSMLSRVAMSWQIEFIKNQFNSTIEFAGPILEGHMWYDDIKSYFSKASDECDLYTLPSIREAVRKAQDDYEKNICAGRTCVGNFLFANYTSQLPAFAFKTNPKDMMNVDLSSRATAILRQRREDVLLQLADVVTSLRATAHFAAAHTAYLSLMAPQDVIMPVEAVAEHTVDIAGSLGEPASWNFTQVHPASTIRVNWDTNDGQYDVPIIQKEVDALVPVMLSKHMSKISYPRVIEAADDLVPVFPFWNHKDINVKIPACSLLSASFVKMPIIYDYVSAINRRRSRYSIGALMKMIQPYAISHSDQDTIRIAAALVAQPARGSAMTIVNAMSAVGFWMVEDTDGKLTKQLNLAKGTASALDEFSRTTPYLTAYASQEVEFYFHDKDYAVGEELKATMVPLIPTVPAIYGVPTNAFYDIRVTESIAKAKESSDRYAFATQVRLADGTVTKVAFVLWDAMPRLYEMATIPWLAGEGAVIPTCVNKELWTKIFSEKTKGKPKKEDDLRAAVTVLSDATMLEMLDAFQSLTKDKVSKVFSKDKWIEPGYFFPQLVPFPHVSCNVQTFDNEVHSALKDAEYSPVRMRVVPNTGDIELRRFYEDDVVILDKCDLDAFSTLDDVTIPEPVEVVDVEKGNNREIEDGNLPPAQAANATPPKPNQAEEASPANSAGAKPNGAISSEGAAGAEAGSGENMIVNGQKVAAGAPGDMTYKHNDEAPGATIPKTPTPGVAKGEPQEKTKPVAGEQEPSNGKPDKNEVEKPEHPKDGGSPAEPKKKRYKRLVDGKIVEIIELAEGETVPEGFVPADENDKVE